MTKALLLGLVTLLLAVIAARYIGADPGFVVLGYGGKIVQMSFVLFVLLFVATIIACYALMRLTVRIVSLRTGLRRWRSTRRRLQGHATLERGYLALAAGDWPQAERLLQRGADADAPLRYLGAAEAAHAQREPARRDNYLALARQAGPEAGTAADLKQAEMLIEEKQYPPARDILRRLRQSEPKNREVLRLLRKLYLSTGEWQAIVEELIPALPKVDPGATAELHELQQCAFSGLLQSADRATGDQIWRRVPRAEREQPALVAAYAAALARGGDAAGAEVLLRKALERQYTAELLDQYGRLANADVGRQMKFVEALQQSRADDPAVLLALGRLSLTRQLWGAARDHLQKLITIQPSPTAYRLLAEAHQQLKHTADAADCFRRGLLLATEE